MLNENIPQSQKNIDFIKSQSFRFQYKTQSSELNCIEVNYSKTDEGQIIALKQTHTL